MIRTLARMSITILSLPVIYGTVAMLLTMITVEHKIDNSIHSNTIYLHTNGVHLDIAIPVNAMDSTLLSGLKVTSVDKIISFGWGDENFYLNTPTWGDLTIENALSALFLKSSSLMHITRYQDEQPDWLEIKVSQDELNHLMDYIEASFEKDSRGKKIYLQNKGYTLTDDFYKAHGSYSIFNTCNSWVNEAFKVSGLKACYWTPFDFGLLDKYD